MAEATGLRNNTLPYPVYGAPYTVSFPIFDADGDLVTGAASLDSEISKNGDTFADCTNEATEIATSSGMYYLTLTGTEMSRCGDGDRQDIHSGAKTTPITLYPRKLVSLATGTSQGGAAGYITLAAATIGFNGQYAGCLCVAVIDSNAEERILQGSTASNQQCTVTPNWNVTPDSDDTYTIYLTEGMQIPTVNTTHVSGTSQTAGDIIGTLGTLSSQVGNIATTGAAAYQAAASFTKTTGGTETGTYENTDTSNGVYHQIADSAGTLDVYYEYTLRPDEVAVGVNFKGRMTGAGDNAVVQAYDWVGSPWVTLFSLTGVGTTTDTTASPSLVGKYTGTGANVGKVRISGSGWARGCARGTGAKVDGRSPALPGKYGWHL